MRETREDSGHICVCVPLMATGEKFSVENRFSNDGGSGCIFDYPLIPSATYRPSLVRSVEAFPQNRRGKKNSALGLDGVVGVAAPGRSMRGRC